MNVLHSHPSGAGNGSHGRAARDSQRRARGNPSYRGTRNPKGQVPSNPDGHKSSYYGMSVINPPVWEEREIAGYLFLGGLAGGSSLLGAVADLTDRPHLATRAKLTASGAIGLSLFALIKDLGRPERFINMLRVVKPTSPMNIGTWIVSAYSPLNFATSASILTGRLPLLGRTAGVGAGALGTLVSTYTGALIADTAVPAWHEGHRELPFLFASSAALAAGGMGLVLAPRRENSPAWRMAVLGGACELVAGQLYERRLGLAKEALASGTAGRRMKLAKALTGGGVITAALLGRRNRAMAATAGAALVASSALTRFGIFAAGMQSAKDPKYTVEPQRERLRRKGIHMNEVPNEPAEPATPIVPSSPTTPVVPDPGTPGDPATPPSIPGPDEPAQPIVPQPARPDQPNTPDPPEHPPAPGTE